MTEKWVQIQGKWDYKFELVGEFELITRVLLYVLIKSHMQATLTGGRPCFSLFFVH